MDIARVDFNDTVNTVGDKVNPPGAGPVSHGNLQKELTGNEEGDSSKSRGERFVRTAARNFEGVRSQLKTTSDASSSFLPHKFDPHMPGQTQSTVGVPSPIAQEQRPQINEGDAVTAVAVATVFGAELVARRVKRRNN